MTDGLSDWKNQASILQVAPANITADCMCRFINQFISNNGKFSINSRAHYSWLLSG
jgi:hypothetical protein